MSTLDRAVEELMRRVARDVIMPRYRNLSREQIEEKAADDLVTIADRESEDMLTDGLSRLEPALEIVGEEAVHADPSIMDRLSGDCWIIDPIDGTRNFAHGNPPFGIIIARSENGLAKSGYILDCLTGRFCSAHSGQGAFADGERTRARPTGQSKPVAALSMLFLTAKQQETVRRTIAPDYAIVDIPRCAAEQYPRLALGQNDVSSFRRTLPWDHAAGALWLNEAGGKAARLDDTPYRVDQSERPGLVGASSPAIWEAFVTKIRANASD